MEQESTAVAPGAAHHELRLRVLLADLANRYQMAVMHAAAINQPRLHAEVCRQRDQAEALVAQLQPALLFQDEPAVG